MRNGQCERSLTRAWRTNEEKRATRELAGFYEFDGHTACLKVAHDEKDGWDRLNGNAYLARVVLTNETCAIRRREPFWREAKGFYV